MKKVKTAEPTELKIALPPEKAAPRFCNHITFGKTKGEVIITMFFVEPDGSGSGVVLDRIIVDIDHAERIVEVLSTLLKK